MSRRKADPIGKASEKAKQGNPKVEFELPDEALDEASGGVATATPTTAVTAVTTVQCMTVTIDGGRQK